MAVALSLVGCAGDREPLPRVLEPVKRPLIVIALESLPVLLQPSALDQFARESAVFEWAFAQAPTTAPSQASLLTGLYPATHGVRNSGDRLREGTTTLAEVLHLAGFRTVMVSNAPPAERDPGLEGGFEATLYHQGSLGDLTAGAIAWLHEHAHETFFFYLHADHTGAGPGDDAEPLAALFAALREQGIDRRAVVALVADHGPHRAALPLDGPTLEDASALPLATTRVPLFLRLPRGELPQRVVQPVETIDLAPTLLELVGVEIPEVMQGDSAVGALAGMPKPRSFAFSESGSEENGVLAVVLAGWRLVRSPRGARLSDIAADPGETRDRSADEPARAQVLLRHLDAWHERALREGIEGVRNSADDDTIEQLRNLGYIQ